MTSSFNVENLLSHLFVQAEANGEEIPSVGQVFLAGRPFALNADWRALHQVGAGNGLTGEDMDEVGEHKSLLMLVFLRMFACFLFFFSPFLFFLPIPLLVSILFFLFSLTPNFPLTILASLKNLH